MRSCLHWKGFLPFFFLEASWPVHSIMQSFHKADSLSHQIYAKKTKQLSLPQRAFCNWMLFLYTLLQKHGVHPCDFHTDFFSYSELLCSMLYLQCVITSMTPSLLEASACCPSAPGTLLLPVLLTAWNEGQPMGTQYLCSHLTHLRHKNPISPLPIPTNQAANQFLLTRVI